MYQTFIVSLVYIFFKYPLNNHHNYLLVCTSFHLSSSHTYHISLCILYFVTFSISSFLLFTLLWRKENTFFVEIARSKDIWSPTVSVFTQVNQKEIFGGWDKVPIKISLFPSCLPCMHVVRKCTLRNPVINTISTTATQRSFSSWWHRCSWLHRNVVPLKHSRVHRSSNKCVLFFITGHKKQNRHIPCKCFLYLKTDDASEEQREREVKVHRIFK